MSAFNGDLKRGQDVRAQNVTAVAAVANIVRSSLGPVGLDKMLVDDLGEVSISNDGATILKQLDVDHPAAKILVQLSHLQDQEVGDGTTSVVLLASELLKQGNELVRQHVHPTSVIAGYEMAKKEALKFVKNEMAVKMSSLPEDTVMNVARTSMSSKIIGHYADFFATMAVKAVMNVQTKGKDTDTYKYNINNVNILKAHGKSARESEMVDGFALNCTRAAQGMPTLIKNAKIALLDIDLRKAKFGLGVQVVIRDPSKLEGIREKESDMTKDRIKLILDSGCNVLLTTKGIDDMALKVFVDHGVIAVRRVKRSDLGLIAQATGAQIIVSLADENGEESFDPKLLGSCDTVSEKRVGDGELIYFEGCHGKKSSTVILRGANDYILDEFDRSFHDTMCAVKRCLECKQVVPGGGCVEAALNVHMTQWAEKMGTREALAVAAFAQSLLVLPKTLSVNGAYDATDLVAKLRSDHYKWYTKEAGSEDLKWSGLNLDTGVVRNNLKAGVLEPAMSKVKMIKFACEAAVTILRIDDAITMKGKEDPNRPHGNHY
jgi:T-complex protein 1 subunit alpha